MRVLKSLISYYLLSCIDHGLFFFCLNTALVHSTLHTKIRKTWKWIKGEVLRAVSGIGRITRLSCHTTTSAERPRFCFLSWLGPKIWSKERCKGCEWSVTKTRMRNTGEGKGVNIRLFLPYSKRKEGSGVTCSLSSVKLDSGLLSAAVFCLITLRLRSL